MGNKMTDMPTLTEADSDHVTGRGDPQQRFRLYRLCLCPECDGSGKIAPEKQAVAIDTRCPECRGEGRKLDLVSTAADPQGLGVAIVTLAEEGEFEDCPIGILVDGGGWLVKPWGASPRNVSDAAKVLAKSKGEK